MLENTDHDLLSEMMTIQKGMVDITESCLHVNIYSKHGVLTKLLHNGTEFDFWLNIRKELESGNSFGIVFNGDIDDSFEDKNHLTMYEIEEKLKFIFNDNFYKNHLEKIKVLNQKENDENKMLKSDRNTGFCGVTGFLFA